MRETKALSNVPEISPGGEHIARSTAVKPLVAQTDKTHMVHSEVANRPSVWKPGSQLLNAKRVKAVVKGPIRCHKCQLMCVDADHYLSHECKK